MRTACSHGRLQRWRWKLWSVLPNTWITSHQHRWQQIPPTESLLPSWENTGSFCDCDISVWQHVNSNMVLECRIILLLPTTTSVSVHIALLWKSRFPEKWSTHFSARRMCECLQWIHADTYTNGEQCVYTFQLEQISLYYVFNFLMAVRDLLGITVCSMSIYLPL